jgi:hypothetical protein
MASSIFSESEDTDGYKYIAQISYDGIEDRHISINGCKKDPKTGFQIPGSLCSIFIPEHDIIKLRDILNRDFPAR